MTARRANGRVLREFAEHPGRYLAWDNGGRITRHLDERACVVVAPTWAVVTAVDVEEDGVAELLDDVRRLVPRGARTEWYIGPSDRPAGLAEELKALGVREPGDGSGSLDALLLDREPTGVPTTVETREVVTMSDYADAAEVRWEAFDMGEDEREHERGFLVGYYEDYVRTKDESMIGFVATVDGRVAGSAAALLSDRGLFLIGGASAPWARGRGVYRALVAARWRYALDRGTPALAVHAIRDTSSPILRRLGFERLFAVRHLEGL